MKPGTPGFVGERLRAAREARGLSAASLAALLGVSRAAVTHYEKGQQTPSPAVVRLMTERLNLPIHQFLRPVLETEPGVVFYRSLSSATKAARTRAQQRYNWVREIVAYLRRYVKFPEINTPVFDIADDRPGQIGHEEVEELSLETRRFWGIGDGPIANLAALLEKSGIILARHELDSDKLDAFSEWSKVDDTPYIILNCEKRSAVRSRYDAGHELGHLVMHARVSRNMLNTPTVFSLMEEQANRFAGAFLLPERTFAGDVHSVSLDSLRVLKAKWRVSVGVMIKRCAHLGLISQSQERRLWINYSRRGWRKREPMDDELQVEKPRYLRRCIELLAEREVVPLEELAFELALPPSDIEQLIGLPSGFFNSAQPPIEITEDATRNVIPFPRGGPGSEHR